MAPRTRAFTLLELLVSIGVIALLVGLIVVSMKGVRAAAGRTESANALRNLMRGYLAYSTDHNNELIPGYLDNTTLELLNIKATLGNQTDLYRPGDAGYNGSFCSGERCDASSWVWRLLPYVDNNWRLLMVDYGDDGLEAILDQKERIDEEYGHGTTATNELGIATVPAYGLNSIFLGGDTTHGDGATNDRNPFTPVDPNDIIAATRTSQVLNPSRITVFAAGEQPDESDWAPTEGANSTTGLPEHDYGYCELRAPYLTFDGTSWGNAQWWFEEDGEIEIINAADWTDGGSHPASRNGPDDVPVGHLDGSTEIVRIYELGLAQTVEQGGGADSARAEVMSRWWPFATGIR